MVRPLQTSKYRGTRIPPVTWYLAALIMLFAGGCTLRGSTAVITDESLIAAATKAAATLAVLPTAGPPTATPVIAMPSVVQSPIPRPLTPSATPLPDPIRFTFPTQGANSISLWRAPLYPTPWAPTQYDHFYFIRPIGADEINWPLARYRYGYLLYAEPHSGIDVPAPKGTTIRAAGSGVVIWAGYGIYYLREQDQDPYGIAVAIRHDYGHDNQTLYTVYGHMDETFIYRGQRVEGGDPIGRVGETGKVSGPHLHFEIRVGDNTFFETRNPELWIAPPQGTGVLVGRIMDNRGEPALRIPVKLFAKDESASYEVLSYARNTVNPDPYYRENVVLGDLPAGEYSLHLEYEGVGHRTTITIQPGLVTYFTWRRRDGYLFDLPPEPGPVFLPPDVTLTPTGGTSGIISP